MIRRAGKMKRASRPLPIVAAIVLLLALAAPTVAQTPPTLTANGPYRGGVNAVVVQGGGSPGDVAARVTADSGLQVEAVWLLASGSWAFYLPTFPGTSSLIALPPVASVFVILGTSRQSGTVVEVIDGDTIRVDIGGHLATVRYIGVDTPETVHPTVGVECYGAEAKAANRALVGEKNITLESDVIETDRFGRLLRYVYVGDTMVNEQLVRDGYAVVSTFPPDVKYADRFIAAEREARSANRGLWAICGGANVPIGGTPAPTSQPSGSCDPAYPTVCIPSPPPDLDCGDIPYRRFAVLPPDPHRFDADRNGVGCEN